MKKYLFTKNNLILKLLAWLSLIGLGTIMLVTSTMGTFGKPVVIETAGWWDWLFFDTIPLLLLMTVAGFLLIKHRKDPL